MATNGKPTTRFVVSYGNLDVSTAEQMLAPVFIAPRYNLHGPFEGYADSVLRAYDKDGVEVVDAEGASVAYDKYSDKSLSKLEATDRITWPAKTDGGVVDIPSATLYARNPILAINATELNATVDAEATNTIILSDEVDGVAGFNVAAFTPTANTATVGTVEYAISGKLSEPMQGIALAEGDVVVVSIPSESVGEDGKDLPPTYKYATVVSIEPTIGVGGGETVINTATGADASALIGVDASAFAETTEVSYMLKFVDGGTVSADGTLNATVTELNNLGAVDLGTFALGVDGKAVDASGVLVSLVAGTTIEKGASFIITISPQPVAFYNRVLLDAPMPAGAAVKVMFGTARLTADLVALDSVGWSCNSSSISVSDSIRVRLTDALSLGVIKADLYMQYRELLTSDSLTLLSSSSTNVAEFAGLAHPDNPMGMMYAAASMVSGAFFYLLSVDANTDEAYAKAIEYAAKFENIYSFVPYKQSAGVRAAGIAEINKYSRPEVAQYKRMWITALSQRSEVVYPFDSSMPTALGSVSKDNKTLTLVGGFNNDKVNFITAKVKRGDVVRLYVGFAAGSATWNTVDLPITKVLTANTVLVDTEEDYNVCRIEVIRTRTASEYAESIAAEARAINSARVTLVASDMLTWGDTYVDVDKAYLAATLATMRAALPPHAPMNELSVPGFTISDTCKWSDADYELMNDGGVWVVYNNSDNAAVTYHQITTLTDGTVAEEDSAVSNGDSIVRALRTALRAKGISGRANVSTALLSTINSTIVAELNYIQGIPYDAMYGSRILSHVIRQLYIPESNRQSVVCRVQITLPLPLQDGLFEFNLI